MKAKEVKDLTDLNYFLEEKEGEVCKLNNNIEDLKYELDLQKRSWQRHIVFTPSSLLKDLPYPRIEMRGYAEDEKFYRVEYISGLVQKHYGCVNNDLMLIPDNMTTITGGRDNKDFNDDSYLPWRQVQDIKAQGWALNLPVYFVFEELGIAREIKKDMDIERLKHMKKSV